MRLAIIPLFPLVIIGFGWNGSDCRRRTRVGPFALTKSNEHAAAAQASKSTLPVGVTALLSLKNDGGVVVGDKRGNLRVERLRRDKNGTTIGKTIVSATPFGRFVNGVTSRPTPIFCLATGDISGTTDMDGDKGSHVLFSGAGDRFLSVWQRDDQGRWVFSTELGPHTGWVRDILYIKQTNHLHSIGCNCIETWVPTSASNPEPGQWQHWKKSSIESSPSEGATLSSDLLCLAASKDSHFFAGGVDGRVHVWDSTTMESPVHSFPAHQARLNALAFSDKGLLYTGGNDGQVKAWQCDAKKGLFDQLAVYALENGRVTSLALLDLGSCGASTTVLDYEYVLCGTNEGVVLLLQSQPDKPSSLKLVTSFQLMHQPIVNSMCLHREGHDENFLWIGHSAGLSVFPLSDFVNVTLLGFDESNCKH